jgi:hypothetical protein
LGEIWGGEILFDLIDYFFKMISLMIIGFCIFCYVCSQYFLHRIFGGYRFRGSSYVFEPQDLHDISKLAQNSQKDMFDIVHKELLSKYPKHIWKGREWCWFNAGGWVIAMCFFLLLTLLKMGSLCILHASLTECILSQFELTKTLIK